MRLITFVIFSIAISLNASAMDFSWMNETDPLQSAYKRGENIRIACMDVGSNSGLKSMYKIMVKDITNMQQVFNAVTGTIWHSKGGCALPPGNLVYTAEREVACAAGVFNCHEVGFVGWMVTKKWLVPIERIAFTGEVSGSEETKAKWLAWRPAAIFDRDVWTLMPECGFRMKEIKGVEIIGHQLTGSHPYDVYASENCSKLVLKSDYDYSPLYNQGRQPGRHYHSPAPVFYDWEAAEEEKERIEKQLKKERKEKKKALKAVNKEKRKARKAEKKKDKK